MTLGEKSFAEFGFWLESISPSPNCPPVPSLILPSKLTLHPTCVTAKPGSGEKNDMALKIVKLKLAQAMNDKVALNITSLC